MATAASIQTRLDAYYIAETEILIAQEMSKDGKRHRSAELEVVKAQIAVLERQLVRQKKADDGNPLGFSVANMNGV